MDIGERIGGLRQSAARLDEIALQNRGKVGSQVAVETAAALRAAAGVLEDLAGASTVPREVELP